MAPRWIVPGVGIEQRGPGCWWLCWGDDDEYGVDAAYPTRRRAKKEITHYIRHGLRRAGHGGLRYLHLMRKQ